jgi:preprotein translocase subunit SecG
VSFLIGILNALIVLGSLFMICIILIQRGKGGGLAGAFGGVGGSSAFGTKAGDVFTKITIGVAIGWILSLMLLVVLTNRRTESAWGNDATSLTKDLAPSSGSSRSKSPVSGTGTGPVPPPPPTPAAGSSKSAPASTPASNLPPLPDIPPIPPSKSVPR